MSRFLAKIIAWVNAGYPEEVPGPDRVPLLALLKRRLTDEEVNTVAQDLINHGKFEPVDIGVLITLITKQMPSAEDTERVRQRLVANGWPLDDPRNSEDAG